MHAPTGSTPTRRLLRWTLRGAAAVLWLAVLALALEFAEHLRWMYIAATNPYLLAKQEKAPWPEADRDYTDQDRARPSSSWGASAEKLPQPTPEAEWAWTAAHFVTLPDEMRERFAQRYEHQVYISDRGGTLLAAHPGMHAITLPEPLAVAIEPMRSVGERPALHARDDGTRIYLYPHEDKVYTFVHPLPGAPPPDEASHWEQYYAIYKKHRCDPTGAFCTNNYGFRDDDILLPKPPEVFRFVCIGGSTTEEGLHNGTSYPNRAQVLLSEQLGTNAVDILNAGISGANADFHPLRLGYHLAMQPDVLVYCLGVNDLCHRVLSLWVYEMDGLPRMLRESRLLTRHAGPLFRPSEEKLRALVEQLVFSNLEFIVQRARSAGVEPVFCSFAAPDPAALHPDERDFFEHNCELYWSGRYLNFDTYLWALNHYNQWLQAWCAERGIAFVPMADHLRGGGELFLDICHVTNHGIERKAQVLQEFAAERWGAEILRRAALRSE